MRIKAVVAAVLAATVAAVVVFAVTLSRPQQTMRQAAADVTPCAASQLKFGQLRTGAASGRVFSTIPVVNRSATTCSLSGYPRLSLIGARGAAMATVVHDGVGALSQSQAVRPIMLAPGSTASVTISFADNASNVPACPAASGVDLGLPGASGSLLLAVPLGPCGGSLQTTPFVAGDNQPS
jgi:hypothetical protein